VVVELSAPAQPDPAAVLIDRRDLQADFRLVPSLAVYFPAVRSELFVVAAAWTYEPCDPGSILAKALRSRAWSQPANY
jgi:hypothetical protein